MYGISAILSTSSISEPNYGGTCKATWMTDAHTDALPELHEEARSEGVQRVDELLAVGGRRAERLLWLLQQQLLERGRHRGRRCARRRGERRALRLCVRLALQTAAQHALHFLHLLEQNKTAVRWVFLTWKRPINFRKDQEYMSLGDRTVKRSSQRVLVKLMCEEFCQTVVNVE